MGFQKQLGRVCAFSLVALGAAAGCGGADAGMGNALQQASQTNNPAFSGQSSASNAPSLVVAMSMVIPKKPSPAAAAAAAAQAEADAQARAAMMAGIPPGGGAPPGGAVPGGAPTDPNAMFPGAGVAGAAAPVTPPAAMAPPVTPAGSGMAKGFEIAGVPEAELSMLRDLCVSEINRYRATLTDRMLTPITRATPEQEECSEKGAKMDGDTGSAHGAAQAGLCSSVGLGSENTCPGYPVGGGGFGGSATIADALKGCLQQMWAEGEPPVSRAECQQDYQNCFLKHGHYLNMSDPNIASVACSFYKMMDGRSYWMNQDFTSNFSGWGR